MTDFSIGEVVMLCGGFTVAVVRRVRLPVRITDDRGERVEDRVLIAFNDDDACVAMVLADELQRC